MHVPHANALFVHVFGQVFGHALGQRRAQRAHARIGHAPHFVQQIVNLRRYRANFDHRVQKTGWPDHLFGKDAAGHVQFPRRGRGRHKDRLRAHCIPFLELQWPVIHARRQAEPVFGQGEFAPIVAFVHRPDLRHADMAFIGKHDGIVWNKLEQGRGRLARRAPGQIARVIFDAVAHACGLKHFQVEICALFQALRFQQLTFAHQLIKPNAQLFFDALNGLVHRWFWRHVMAVGIDADLFKRAGFFARQRIKLGDRLQLFAEKRQLPGPVLEVRGKNLERIATHPEGSALKGVIVAPVLLRNQIGNNLALVIDAARLQILRHCAVGFDRADTIDARHRRHDDHVITF